MSWPLLENVEHTSYCSLWARIYSGNYHNLIIHWKFTQSFGVILVYGKTNKRLYDQDSYNEGLVFSIIYRYTTVPFLLDQVNDLHIQQCINRQWEYTLNGSNKLVNGLLSEIKCARNNFGLHACQTHVHRHIDFQFLKRFLWVQLNQCLELIILEPGQVMFTQEFIQY